ncbi:MAG: alpha/beta hydrolase [Betaproteobacteria bacterium]|nr:alpha/beta hydrolase [Betaproteobacteria bacterium]
MSTWILLRGLTREARHWGDFPQQLSQVLEDSKVIALDLPGNGEFNAKRSPMSIGGMTEHCRAELMRRGLTPPYRLLAISMGGMVAVDWAARYDREIELAVLINTSMRPFSPFHHRLQASTWLRMLRLFLPASPGARESAIFALTSNLPEAPHRLIEQWIEIRQSRPVSASNALRQLLAAARFRAPVAAPSAKLQIVGSANDRLVDVSCSMALAQAWNGEAILHPVAGHDLPLDDPNWLADQVQNLHKALP